MSFIKMRYIFFTIIFPLFLFVTHSETTYANDKTDWSDIDRRGLSTDTPLLAKNMWEDYTQEEALKLLDQLPNSLSHSAYREMIRRVLLSPVSEKWDTDTPDFLIKRLEWLIRYGLIADANALYATAIDDLAENILHDHLLEANFTLSALRNGLAPACLDLQAESTAYENSNFWQTLSNVCSSKFGNSDQSDKDNVDLNISPLLTHILGLADTPSTAYPDLDLYITTNKNPNDLCAAISATYKGVRSLTFLEKAYKSSEFKKDNHIDITTLSACDLPAYIYQLHNQDNEKEESPSPLSLETVRTLLSMTKAKPPIALSPLSDILLEHFDELSPHDQWRIAQAVILSNKNVSMPEYDETSTIYVLAKIADTESIDEKDYKNWLEDEKNANYIKSLNIDSSLILYISHILNSNFTNILKNKEKINYEKTFSLTYQQKSLGLGLGFADYIARQLSDGKDESLVISEVIALGNHAPSEVNIRDMAVILSSLKHYKLEKKAIGLAFEYLQ